MGSNSGAFLIASNSEQPGSPRPPVTVKILNSNKVAPPCRQVTECRE